MSFKVNPGETVALVGPTGSGKSSCMSIHRFYDVQQGQVLVGGHDVRALTQDLLGDQIAMVLQEPFSSPNRVRKHPLSQTGRDAEKVIEAARPSARRLHHTPA